MRAVHCILIAAALAIATPASAQQPRIEAEMSASERSAAGLDKLSPAELVQLNAWIAQRDARTAVAAPAAADVDARIAEAREAGRIEGYNTWGKVERVR